MSAEHAVVITRMREENWKDEVMQRLAKDTERNTSKTTI